MENAEKNPLEVLLDVFIGSSMAVYHFTEDFVLGVVEMIEGPGAALEALATMVFNPIDTGYYLGKIVVDSFVRHVIHGDAESRAHWFVYASSIVLGPKAVKQVGKRVDSKAKAGAQKAEQQLDDLLPYHPKHQVAPVEPVPYNVFNGGFFVDRLVMMAERTPGSLGGVRTKGGNKTRLPRTNGKWVGDAGSGKWYSDKREVKNITNGQGVEFLNGRPNFTPWSKGSIKFKKGMLDGSINDFNLVYEKIMQLKGFKSKNQARAWLKEKGLTPHHKSSTEIELIPTDLHGNIPHIGSASDLRGGR